MSEFSSAAFRQGTHKVPEKIISFKGREIDEMEHDESDQGVASDKKKSNKFEGYEDYYKDYQDYGEDYYLPQQNFQVESERSTHKHEEERKPKRIRKEADEFKWYLPHAKKA